MAHKASTREHHYCRSATHLVMVFHVRPHSFISFSTVRLHVSFGRPRLLFPSAVQCKAVLGSAPGDIRHTCPSHLHLLFCILYGNYSLTTVSEESVNRIMLAVLNNIKHFSHCTSHQNNNYSITYTDAI